MPVRSSSLFKKLFLFLLVLLTGLCVAAYGLLRASLPSLDGEQPMKGLTQTATLERDAGGMAVLSAGNRLDLARATGFAHGQERFFQMDLLRRNSAGELSALFGEAALDYDRKIRLHRFRHRAEQLIENLSADHRQLILAYTEGVNQGLASLSAKPFEYYLLQSELVSWQPADTLLTLYSMYLDLQDDDGSRDFSLTLMRDHLPDGLYAFLHPAGSEWDAPIDNSIRAPSAIPAEKWPQSHSQELVQLDGESEDRLVGSNNWAVSGELTPYRSAMLADDMHLGIRVPNIWYKAQFNWTEADRTHQITGVTLPGTPLMVVGSNGHLAWGFTNSYGDWSDLIRLQLDETGEKYLTPEGYLSFQPVNETIRVKGQPAVTHTFRETIWGPVIGEDAEGNLLAYRWVAHDPEGANMNLIGMEQARTVEDGFAVGARAGIPAQNLVMADSQGNIGWTVAGAMPIRFGYDGRYISDWSQGNQGWAGYRHAEDYPRLLNPEQHRLWTANSRVVGGSMYDKIGDGGYALGARSRQIRDDLFAKERFSEQDLLAIQLDDEAVFLSPWRELLLNVVVPGSQHPQLDDIRQALKDWSGHAAEDDLGYLLVRQFRLNVRDKVYQDLNRAMLEQSDRFDFNSVRNQLEVPLWQLVSARPAHLVPSDFNSWQELFNMALTDTLAGLDEDYGDWRQLNWGQFNQVEIRHPLSAFVPLLGKLTDMPAMPLAGDSFMPRVARNAFGASQRLVVAPGHEDKAIFHMPSSQAGHPLSPYFGVGHEGWRTGQATGMLPGDIQYRLTLVPSN
ncbi:penicillin acylase family protein [Bowmanella dokdonensis]|uniref:Penicillin acylase family protein n=1 Tax=Bowmanella dokdonensis TaxID=751969 RepID=A0A939DPW9_9ALTE|nr:penicillin acylase family protein [Bowmanella dokdonensis]MBN7826789.1 penicillin acylase family protein [Bowmanella dokdonensis]